MTGLLLLHPISPYLTEELYQRLPILEGDTQERKPSIMEETYPSIQQVVFPLKVVVFTISISHIVGLF